MKNYIIFLMILLFAFSCRKEKDIEITQDNEYPTEKYINASVKGIVVGERDMPIENAVIETGDYSMRTDFNGYFYFKDIKVNSEGATIQVSKEGYSTITKIYYPQWNSTTFLKFKLEPEHGSTVVKSDYENKNFASSSGFISISGNKFLKDGKDYVGDLYVKPFWTAFDNPDFYEKYIGHPIGYDKDFNLKGLKSYGIVGLDIRDKYGDKIEFGDKNTMELRLIFDSKTTIPPDLPDKIPVWYFDIQKDKWLEKTSAIWDSDNRYYSADIDKTGYWNFATPFDVSPATIAVKSQNGDLLPDVITEISSLKNNYLIQTGTNSNGKLFCFLPDNEESQLDLVINGKNVQKKISVSDTEVSVPVDSKSIPVKAKIFDCDDNPIDKGYVTLIKNENSLFYYFENGVFEKVIIFEESDEKLQWFFTNLKQGINTEVHSSIVEDTIDMQDVFVCTEPFAIFRYGDVHQILDLDTFDFTPPVLFFEFDNSNYFVEFSFLNFEGINGNYDSDNFSHTISIGVSGGGNRIFSDFEKKQIIKVIEFDQPGMMRGYIKGWAYHKDNGIVLDSAYLKIDYSLKTE